MLKIIAYYKFSNYNVFIKTMRGGTVVIRIIKKIRTISGRFYILLLLLTLYLSSCGMPTGSADAPISTYQEIYAANAQEVPNNLQNNSAQINSPEEADKYLAGELSRYKQEIEAKRKLENSAEDVPVKIDYETVLPEHKYATLAVRKNQIYYLQNDSPPDDYRTWYTHLYSMNTNGTNKKRITPYGDGINNFFIDGNWIYYDAYAQGRNIICKIGIYGTGYQRLYDVRSSGSGYGAADVRYTQGYIYFTDWETYEIFRIDVETGKREKIDGIWELNLSKAHNGFVYSRNGRNRESTDNSLYRIDDKSTTPIRLSGKISNLDIVWTESDWIYYRANNPETNPDSGAQNAPGIIIRRVRTDGTGDELVKTLKNYKAGPVHTVKGGNHYIYSTESSDEPSGEEFVGLRTTKFIRYSVADDIAEEIGQITYKTYYTEFDVGEGEGYIPPDGEEYKYYGTLLFDVTGNYIYYSNPGPQHYGKIFRMRIDGINDDSYSAEYIR
jgi:hypothetical protein